MEHCHAHGMAEKQFKYLTKPNYFYFSTDSPTRRIHFSDLLINLQFHIEIYFLSIFKYTQTAALTSSSVIKILLAITFFIYGNS